MTLKDIPPTWHLQVMPIVFAGIFYFVMDRSTSALVSGAALGVLVFLFRYIDAEREALAAMEERLARLEQERDRGVGML